MAKIFGKINIPVNAASDGGALQGFIWNRIIRGEKIDFSSDVVTVYGTDSNVQPTFAELIAIVQAGGYFEGIKLALEFANVAAAQQNVPVSVRGATYLDEEGVEQTRTWIEWFRVNSTVQVITNGTIYVAKAVFNSQLLNSDELTVIHAQIGIQVIEWDVVKARYQDSDNWETIEI